MIALLLLVVSSIAPGVDLESPRLARLAESHRSGDAAALADFWREIAGKAPLVESIAGDPEHVLVTFLWRGDSTTERAVLGGGVPDGCGEKPLQLLPGTDLWYRTERVPSKARFSYRFRLNAPADAPRSYDQIAARERGYPTRSDPLNPSTHPLDGSMVRLSAAAPLPATDGRELRGRVQETTIDSAVLHGTRPLWIYTPPGHESSRAAHDLLVVLDGRVGLNALRVPALLEDLTARGTIRPTVAVFVGSPSPTVRADDYLGSTAFVDFLAGELIPMMQTRYRVSRSPAHHVIAGVSLGGFAATFAAYTRPDIFGGVISLSGAHWYYPGWRSQPIEPWTETGWLTRRIAATPRKPLRVFLAAGTMESACPYSYLAENRRLADVLTALRYPVRYVELIGGHDVENWLLTMPAALDYVLGRGTSPPR
ncbi:MAG TPA: alpha/beta hydrolase-fold protein [Thermoanaerobaculia bacterium]